MFRFTIRYEMPGPISDREKDVAIQGETLEAAQAELYALPSRWLPQGVPPNTPWTLLHAREVFPPTYE
jgi:hypothetical protein